MTSGPNIRHGRRRQRPAPQHFHQHVHRHQTLAIYQAAPVAAPVVVPFQPPPSARPTLQLSPTIQAIAYSRVYAPVYAPSMTSVRSYSPTIHATQPFQPAATQPVQRQDDSFGSFIAGLLSAVAIGAAVLGSSGSRKRR
jgi:hypothetical protein